MSSSHQWRIQGAHGGMLLPPLPRALDHTNKATELAMVVGSLHILHSKEWEQKKSLDWEDAPSSKNHGPNHQTWIHHIFVCGYICV